MTNKFYPCKDLYMQRIIHISIDGLSINVMNELGKTKLPNIFEIKEGLFTDDARTDSFSTETLPNHTCMMTGKNVYDDNTHYGHNIDYNLYRPETKINCETIFTILNDKYDTASYVSKIKLNCYGAKINYVNKNSGEFLVGKLIHDMSYYYCPYIFLHFGLTDSWGHSYGWNSDKYKEALIKTDGEISALLNYIKYWEINVIIVLTTDHGGGGKNIFFHNDFTDPVNYTIPMYIQTYPNKLKNLNLYDVVKKCNKCDTNKDFYIKNGDVANFVMGFFNEDVIKSSKMTTLYNFGKILFRVLNHVNQKSTQ